MVLLITISATSYCRSIIGSSPFKFTRGNWLFMCHKPRCNERGVSTYVCHGNAQLQNDLIVSLMGARMLFFNLLLKVSIHMAVH